MPSATQLDSAALCDEPGVMGGRGAMRAIWPALALLAAEVLAIVLLAPPQPGDVTPAGLLIAVVVLIAGGAPALLRPTPATNLVACSAIALASVLWRAADLGGTVPSFAALAPALDTPDGRLNLLNTVLIAPLTLHLAAIFPQRDALKPAVVAGYYTLVVGVALVAWFLPLARRPTVLIALVAVAYAGFGMAGYQFLRTVRSVQNRSPRAAQQARLLLLILFFAEAPFLLLPLSTFIRVFIPYELILGAQIVLPLGVAYIVTRHDLFGIDAALRRTLDYTLVSFGLLVIYFGLTALLTQISRDLGGTTATVASVLVAALAFTPLRRVTQCAIDRAFYPERLRFGTTITAARTTLSRVVRRDAIVRLFEQELPRDLGAGWGRLVLRPAFDQPAPEAGSWSTLLTVGGEAIGAYALGPRSTGIGYAPDEQEQLQSLVQQAALALAYAETVDALQQLNGELEEQVATRTAHVVAQQRELAALEERQRLARELHDSVKQGLFSLGIGLRTARNRVRNDPEAATLLAQHEQSALQIQAELGELLDHLRTPANGPADLVALLEHQIAWFAEQHGLAVTAALPAALVLTAPQPRELAQVAREALQNVLRHSGTRRARLTLGVDDGLLTLVIADHGRGFDPAQPRSGHGVHTMRDRVALLGGTLTVETTPGGGTTVWVRVRLA